MRTNTIITLREYERIFKIAHAIILGENSDPEVSCPFFSFLAAHILKKHYRLNAQLKCGLAIYVVGPDPDDRLCFGELQGNAITSSIKAFHCWLELDGWVIDFSAPLIPEIIGDQRPHLVIKPLMFQKQLNKMANAIPDLSRPGDFFHDYSPSITEQCVDCLHSRQAFDDLANLSADWYKKPPKRIDQSLSITDAKGNIKVVKLKGPNVVGVW